MTPNTKSDESDLSAFARTLRRRWWVVLLCVVVATAAAVGITLHAEKKYAATTSLLLRVNPEVEPQRVVDTNLQLLSLPNVASKTAQSLPDVSQTEVEDAVASEQQGESDIIKVTATTTDPDLAAEIANAYATEFIALRRTSNKAQQTGAVETVEQATPDSSPVSPNATRNVVFGIVIGLILGVGIALLLEQLDRRVKSQDDLADTMGIPLLATVAKRKAFDRKHLGNGEMSPEDLEAFRMLRANLRYFDSNRDIKSVLITSAEPGEGKTLVSLGLALAAAAAGERVLLLEADLRDPGLSRVLKLPQVAGLSSTLTEGKKEPSGDAMTSVAADELTKSAGEVTIDVLPAGAIPPNPPALLESQTMKDLIAQAETNYDFVVIDTPPILAVADAIPLISIVSGVLVVSGLGVSTRSSAGDLIEQLNRLSAPILGLVVNFAQGGQQRSYGYGRPAEIAVTKPQSDS
jgi:tyrosine-protein kinase